ncbi:MAG: riboflavin synthase [Nitriliruptorales bacterium]|nr:riboflavin synthase [Nitriliruptorales bacterium]
MFTGIVQEVGRVAGVETLGDGHVRLAVDCEAVVSDAAIGDSISVEGCCLTVTALEGGFTADLMAETLRATSLGALEVGDPVNLEPALAAGDRLGGHLVQGHVDAVGTVLERQEQPGTVFLRISAPPEVAPYLVPKGSVTVAGTSLTVVDVDDPDTGETSFRVALVPHTVEVTTLGHREAGDPVNLEADVIAKYVARLLAAGAETPYRAPDPRQTD